jgi:hypothetical protein
VVGNGLPVAVQAHVARRRSVDSTFHGHAIGRAERQGQSVLVDELSELLFRSVDRSAPKPTTFNLLLSIPLLSCLLACFPALFVIDLSSCSTPVTADYTRCMVSRTIMAVAAGDFSTATKGSSCDFRSTVRTLILSDAQSI